MNNSNEMLFWSQQQAFISFQIIINKTPTKVSLGGAHFNMKGTPVKNKHVWDVKKLLEVSELELWESRK